MTGLVWASSNVAVATVDEAGKVTPVGPGTTDITATLNAFEAKVVVTVKAAPTGDPTEFVVKPVRGTLEVDKNAKLTTPELIATHISGLPVGTTVSATEVFVGVGGGSSSTDSMPDSYTVIKFGTSKLGGSLTVTLPAEDLIESVTIKGRSWNTDESSLTVNGVSKDFTNATPTNKEDIRTFEYELPTATNVLEFVSVKRVILTEITLKLQVEAPVEPSMDLFISEWIEPASGNNKFIEIYNPLAEAVDLSTYTMKAFPNGAATASATLALTGTLAAGETIVIYNVQQVIITTEIPSTWISQSYPGLTDFNGDDTFGLFNNDVLIDLVGEIGVDPGTEWSGLDFLGASVQTKDSNWTRHGSITVPNATFTMAEWVVGPWDTHTLGSHTVVTA